MQHHGNIHVRTGQRKQIVLALSLALGLAATQGQASPSTGTGVQPYEDGPAAGLMRHAAEAGISLPADLPKFLERRAREKARAGDATPKGGTVIPVTNCNDSGPGSLRAAIGFAATSGDIVDLSGAGCTSITLTSSIVTSLDDLTIRHDPATAESKYTPFLIFGGGAPATQVRQLEHTGTGTLTLEGGIALRQGRITTTGSAPAQGGCIRSNGSVTLRDGAQVKYCAASSASGNAQGGAIFAANSVSLVDGARVANSTATTTSGNAMGGGIHASLVSLSGGLVEKNTARVTGGGITASGGGIASDRLSTKYSIIRDNNVTVGGSATALAAHSGGAEIRGDGASLIKYSTFNNNKVDASGAVNGGGAAIAFGSSSNPGSLQIRQSTIANNDTTNARKYGGALSLRKNATIRSSTISGNIERNAEELSGLDVTKYGAGITLADGVTLTMTSSIIGGNNARSFTGSETGWPSDLGVSDPEDGDVATVVGTQNYYRWVHPNVTWPAGNVGGVLTSVRLGPLQDNGGLTATMFPNSDSPVIDQGGTTGVGGTDQRGSGFPRVVGTQADIGAVEWSLRPEIFEDGFED